jgi:dCTP deaminase
MIYNKQSLLSAAPIKDMLTEKVRGQLCSHGLSEAGYDIRVKQDVIFSSAGAWVNGYYEAGSRFVLASAIEEFQMPEYLVGVVHDKSTWARQGLSVFNTVLEPGWKGFLTLELVYHGRGRLHIPAGTGIAQVIFHEMMDYASYDGKYQNQADRPVEAING